MVRPQFAHGNQPEPTVPLPGRIARLPYSWEFERPSFKVGVRQNETDFALSSRQQRAVTALTSGATIVNAAKRARVSRATVHRWLREPDFRAALQKGLQEL